MLGYRHNGDFSALPQPPSAVAPAIGDPEPREELPPKRHPSRAVFVPPGFGHLSLKGSQPPLERFDARPVIDPALLTQW
jgi:hypothetical protein